MKVYSRLGAFLIPIAYTGSHYAASIQPEDYGTSYVNVVLNQIQLSEILVLSLFLW